MLHNIKKHLQNCINIVYLQNNSEEQNVSVLRLSINLIQRKTDGKENWSRTYTNRR